MQGKAQPVCPQFVRRDEPLTLWALLLACCVLQMAAHSLWMLLLVVWKVCLHATGTKWLPSSRLSSSWQQQRWATGHRAVVAALQQESQETQQRQQLLIMLAAQGPGRWLEVLGVYCFCSRVWPVL